MLDITYVNDQTSTVRWSYAVTPDGGAVNTIGGRQQAAGTTFNIGLGTSNSQVTLQFNKTTGIGLFKTNYYGSILLTAITNPTGDADTCRYQATYQTSQSGLNFLIFLP